MKSIYFLLTLFIILTSYGIQAGVQYVKQTCTQFECRKVITTTYVGSTTSNSRKIEKASYDNSKGKTALEKTYSFSLSTSRTMSASASVGTTVLGKEVKASLGGDASYKRTQNYSYKVKIPAGKIGHIYLSEKTSIAKFRHVIQPQIKEGQQNWKNNPNSSMKVEFSTVTTKTPEFSLATN